MYVIVVIKADYSVSRKKGTLRYEACRLHSVWLWRVYSLQSG